MTQKRPKFIVACYYIGAAADLLAVIPLFFPGAAAVMFGLAAYRPGPDSLYASRIAGSLMLGWTFLLIWGSFKPVERRGVLLLTLFPVLGGLWVSSILAVRSGFAAVKFMVPLWIFYASITPLFIAAFVRAGRLQGEE